MNFGGTYRSETQGKQRSVSFAEFDNRLASHEPRHYILQGVVPSQKLILVSHDSPKFEGAQTFVK
jgi:hypothetical protein